MKGPAPAGLLLLASLWLGLEYFALGPFSYFDIHDTGDYSPMTVEIGRLSTGGGLWLPWTVCGTDRLSNNLSRVSLSGLLFRFLPGWLAYQVMVLGQFFCCAYFSYRLARDRLVFEERHALFAGLAALVCLEAWPSSETVFSPGYEGGWAMLPLALWALEGAADPRARCPWLRVIALGLLNGVCSSLALSLPFCLAITALWFAVVRGNRSPRLWGLYVLFCSASALPHLQTAWALTLNAAFSQRAHRAPGVASWATLQGEVLVNLFQDPPILPLVIALAGLAFGGWRDGLLWRLLGSFLICAAGGEFVEYLKSGHLEWAGPLRGFSFVRCRMICPFLSSIAAARGLAFLPKDPRVLGLGVTALLLQTVPLKLRNISDWYFMGGYTAMYESPILKDIAARREEPFRVATFTHGLAPAAANAYGLETADGNLNLYQGTYHRFWAKVIEPLIAQDSHYRDFFLKRGNSASLFMGDAEPFIGGLTFSKFYRLNLLSLANAKYLISRIPLLHPDLAELHAPAPWPRTDRAARLRLRLREIVSGKTHLYVYENTTSLPRAFLAAGVRYFPDDARLLDALAATDPETLRATVFLHERFAAGLGDGPFSPGRVSFWAHAADRLELTANARGPALLVLTNSYSPFWRCEVDGVAAEIMPAYGTFWGVRLPPGARRITFRYAPPYKLL
jgi:hypothetical protein